MRTISPLLALFLLAAPARAQVFVSEFFGDPSTEGWGQLVEYCEPETWNDQGRYYQRLDSSACLPAPPGGQDLYRRSLEPYNETARFFLEFRLEADGDRSEISFASPAVVAMGNSFGINYHITIARDLVKFLRDVQLPIFFFDVASDTSHTYRVELRDEEYRFFIDNSLVDEGVAEGLFPSANSQILWQGSSWYLPCHNAWDYIRYGRIPDDGSGDYDSDGVASLFDHYFVVGCLTKDGPGIFGGPDQTAGPGCRFTDFDADDDTDLFDFAEFQNLFGGE